jgi:hypothetical protein
MTHVPLVITALTLDDIDLRTDVAERPAARRTPTAAS